MGIEIAIIPLIVFAASFAASTVLVRLGIWIAHRVGFVNHPNPIVQNHKQSVALGGGMTVVGVILGACCVLSVLGHLGWRIPLAVLPMFILGSVDDIVTLSPGRKFLLQCAAVVPYLALSGCCYWLAPAIGLFLLASANAWNLIDIMDGLLGWIAVTCLIGFFAVFVFADETRGDAALVAAAEAGALAGFLVWNSHPAKVYLGDAGSLVLGMLFGILVVEGSGGEPTWAIPMVFAGMIPFFEMGFLVVERTKKGIPFYRRSPDHFALRLLNNGYRVPSIVRAVACVGMALSLLTWLIVLSNVNKWVTGSATVLLLVGFVVAYRGFRSLPVWNGQQEGQS